MPSCPTCDESFGSENGMKTHHALAHGESISGVSVECSNCGTAIRRKPYLVEQQDNFFCDRNCLAEHRSETQTGVANPNYKSKIVECAWCGAELERPQSRIERQDKHFCDKKCDGKWRSENWAGKDSSFYGHVSVECAWCGESFERQPYKIADNWGSFCDNECQLAWMRENLQGEDNPRWNGGWERYYGANWKAKREERLTKDGHECFICGRDDDLQVHHIQPIATFDDPEDANNLDNLITLCRPCHRRWEGIPLRPDA